MITQNWKNGLLAKVLGTTIYGVATDGTKLGFTTNNTNGMYNQTYVSLPNALTANYRYALFGNGTTQPTELDTDLENQVDVTVSSTTSMWTTGTTDEYDSTKLVHYITVTNNNSDNVSISELGIFAYISSKSYLLCREVFDTITLAKGESRTFEVVLE